MAVQTADVEAAEGVLERVDGLLARMRTNNAKLKPREKLELPEAEPLREEREQIKRELADAIKTLRTVMSVFRKKDANVRDQAIEYDRLQTMEDQAKYGEGYHKADGEAEVPLIKARLAAAGRDPVVGLYDRLHEALNLAKRADQNRGRAVARSLGKTSSSSAFIPLDRRLTLHPHRLVLAARPRDASPSPEQATTPEPVLITTLSASDGESILCVAVEEETGEAERGRTAGRGGATAEGKGGARSARIYGGSQGGSIHVWDYHTLSPLAILSGHTGAVLALLLVKERDWLISASGDGTIRVWHTPSLSLLYLIHPPHDNTGDILSLAWVPYAQLQDDGLNRPRAREGRDERERKEKPTGRLFAGCQDTSMQWIDLPPPFHLSAFSSHRSGSPLPRDLASSDFSNQSSSPPILKSHNKFFDSLSNAEKVRARAFGGRNSLSGGSLHSLEREATTVAGNNGATDEIKEDEHAVELQFAQENIVPFAHYGYIYCLLVAKKDDKMVLVTGSGDELVRLWRPTVTDLLPLSTLEYPNSSNGDAVLALAVRDSTVFAGHQGGVIRVWDLDTLTCIRVLRPHDHDVLTLTVHSSSLFSGLADGSIQRWDSSFRLVHQWHAHDSIVLSSEISFAKGNKLITGGNDASVRVWDIAETDGSSQREGEGNGFQGELYHYLAKLISYRTIADDTHREECRQGALYLRRVLRTLGAETSLLPTGPASNPIVLATFRANAAPKPNRFEAPRRKRCLFYAHYDVVDASAPELWSSDPFEMKGKGGWVLGRGTSDNKGPLLAIASAASELRKQQALEVDVVMVIEGEEEAGSTGFQDAIKKHRDLIGDIDVILVSNSYWLGEDVPCLTFGLRGVIHATVRVASDQPDLHSGIWGGVTSEPLGDLVRLLATLTDAEGKVRIPGFLDNVRKLSPEEKKLYDAVVERCKALDQASKLGKHSHIADPMESLITRWRQPALSVHKVEVPGPAQKTLIPNCATASVSIRIVPDQRLDDIVEQLKAHLRACFDKLNTRNSLTVDINHVADWWLGDVTSPYVAAMSSCIADVWDIQPLFIREGGSIPSLPFLEREFGADAVHFPMGTSSDAAHLPDEKIRISNLENGKEIVQKWFGMLGSLPV
ncbi:hypothetical protein JCM11641_005597 [Rhodosporidiobolus odoratus]